jgi:hypothetical protein
MSKGIYTQWFGFSVPSAELTMEISVTTLQESRAKNLNEYESQILRLHDPLAAMFESGAQGLIMAAHPCHESVIPSSCTHFI